MIREVRKLEKTNKAKADYVRTLQVRKKIRRIINEKKFVCYDTEELKQYLKTAKKGRPIKIVED